MATLAVKGLTTLIAQLWPIEESQSLGKLACNLSLRDNLQFWVQEIEETGDLGGLLVWCRSDWLRWTTIVHEQTRTTETSHSELDRP